MKSFLLLFLPGIATRDQILNHLDTMANVPNWYAFHPNAVFVIHSGTAHTLTDAIHAKFPKLSFYVTENEAGKNNGWLMPKCWEFVNNLGNPITKK